MQKQAHRKVQIQLQAHLDESWSEWFEGFSITYPDEQTTVLSGQLQDQAQLHAVLNKIRDLNLVLESVNQINDTLLEE